MSPNQIQPGQPYTLSYFITDHTDTATYYVKAVVYDATTGEVLDTQVLTAQSTNTRLFSQRAQAPGDSSGMGRRIITVATAYTDSGYTTKSGNYQEQSEVYLVKKDQGVIGGGGMGGGFGTDYVKIREIVEAVFDKKEKEEALKEDAAKAIDAQDTGMSGMDMHDKTMSMCGDILKGITDVAKAVSDIPKDKIDLDVLKSDFETIANLIKDKEVTEKTELEPVLNKLDVLETKVSELESSNAEISRASVQEIKSELSDTIVPAIKDTIESSQFTLEMPKTVKANAKIPNTKEPVAEPQPSPFDITKLFKQ